MRIEGDERTWVCLLDAQADRCPITCFPEKPLTTP